MKVSKTKSLKINSVLNAIRALISVFFPLITFKYASRILHVDTIGKYNFSNSIVTYFLFISALGINAYSIRNGAAIRESREKVDKFASEIFTINLWSTLVAYILLIVSMCFFRKLDCYRPLIFILSMQIIFKTLGIEWLFSIYEDYFFITLRCVFFQLISLILLLLLVKNENDVNYYALVTVISSAGSGIADLICSRKYCKLRILKKVNLKKHIIPILIIFAQNISVLIYVNSDMTLLSLLASDYNTGLYSIATNIYKGVKALLSALVMVSIPRLSFYLGKGQKIQFNNMINKIFETMMTFLFPIIIGIMLLSKEIIIILSGSSFLDAEFSVKMLCIATLFCMLSYIYGQCILIPLHKEKILLVATIISALVNVGLNFIMIPIFVQNGAAFTTIIAEMLVFLFLWIYIRNEVKIYNGLEYIIKPLVGCFYVAAVCICIRHMVDNIYLKVFFSIFFSIIVYLLVEIMLKNRVIIELIRLVRGLKIEN